MSKRVIASRFRYYWLLAFVWCLANHVGSVFAQDDPFQEIDGGIVIKKAMLEMMRRRGDVLLGDGGNENAEDFKGESSISIKGVSFASKSGILETMAEPLTDYLTIKETPESIRLNLPSDINDGQNFQQTIGRLLGGFGGSSSSGGGSFSCVASTGDGNASCSGDAEGLKLDIQELQGQKRSLHAMQTNDLCQIRFTNVAGYFLSLKLSPGRVVVTEFDTDFVFHREFSSLGQLQLAEAEYYQSRLGPMLKRFGVKPPADIFSPLAQNLAKQLLLLPAQDLQAFVEKQQSQVANADYKIRQSAWKELADHFTENQILIAGAILSEELPAEFRHQLVEVAEKTDDQFYVTLNHAFLKQRLLSDVAFLSWLLKTEQESAEKNSEVILKIRQKLSVLTEMPADTAVDDWLNVAQLTALPTDEKRDSSKQMAAVPSLNFKVSATGINLSELIPLKEEDSKLVIDRLAWKKPFGKGSLQSHFDQMEEQLLEKGFPKSWLKPPTNYSLKEDTYPLVLFEKLNFSVKAAERFFPNSHFRHSRQSLKNQVSKQRNGHNIELNMGQGRVRLASSEFDFVWTATETEEFSVLDDGGDSFCLTIQDLKEGNRLFVKSLQNRFDVQCLNGGKIFSKSFNSYQEFCETQPEFFGQMKDTFEESFGIVLPKSHSKTAQE